MMIRFGSAQLIAIPVAEILASLEQLAANDSAVSLPPLEFDTLEDFLKPGKELFDNEIKEIDERLATFSFSVVSDLGRWVRLYRRKLE